MKPKSLPAILLFFSCVAFFQAQSAAAELPVAEEIEALLAANAVTYAQAARFLLEASDAFAKYDSQEAFRYAQEQKWLPKKAGADDKARLDEISLLAMRSFEMKGGVMYSITKNKHYSYRELAAKKIIQGRTSPSMKITGRQLLYITERMLSSADTEN